MKRKLMILFVAALSLSACAKTTASSSDIAGLYTGYETGSWYELSSSCSAKLCPAY